MTNSPTIPRAMLATLVYALPVFVVMLAVVAAGHLLVAGGADPPAAKALRVAGIIILMLITTDLILLVGALGLTSLVENSRQTAVATPEEDSTNE